MRQPDSSQIIPLSVVGENPTDPIQWLTNENCRFRQIIEEQADTIDRIANTMALQKELIQSLRDEIAILKGQKPKPKISPSKLEGQNRKPDWHKRIGLYNGKGKDILFSVWVSNVVNPHPSPMPGIFSKISTTAPAFRKRSLEISRLARLVIKKVRRVGKPGQPKGRLRRKKKSLLEIHEKRVIHPENIPEGAEFKGFNRYTVQDLVIKPHNIQYQLARWMLPDGSYITGESPKHVQGHYGPQLIAYVLHQYHSCRVTENLLLNQLRTIGVLISAGQLNNILIENKDVFVEEVAELLPVAVKVEGQIQTDDTGGRHNGQNQYTTIIGNRWFSVFATTESKSRINFLKLLQGGKEEYVINEDTLFYLALVNVQSHFPGYVSMSL